MKEKLIELLSPYMNKTLSEGCYIKFKEIIEPHSNKLRKITYVYWKDNDYFILDWSNNVFRDYQFRWGKILWHFDITSVLKYINRNKINLTWVLKVDYINDKIWFYLNWFIFSIPNKPLNLYTKKELEDLYNLLIKLWKQS